MIGRTSSPASAHRGGETTTCPASVPSPSGGGPGKLVPYVAMDIVIVALFVIGLALLVAGAELLVRGASRLAASFGVSAIVVGLTVVAFGTSAPEFAVSVGAAIAGEPDLVLGNVVGSNIYNVLLILGLSAVIAPLVVGRQMVRREVPLMVAASLGTLLLGLDGSIGRLDGVLMFGSLLVWVAYLIRGSRALMIAEHDAPAPSPRGRGVNVLLVIIGLAMLVVGARWLVDGAVAAATALGLSELVIALTIVAVGTSLPELATSVIAAIRGERDIAVGNIVGSNVFNLLAVLGISAIVAGDVPIAEGALTFDMPVMVAVAVACLPIFFTGFRIARWEGVLFLGYAVGYTAYLLGTAVEHPTVPGFTVALATVIVPLTAVTLLVLLTREVRLHRRARPAA